MQTGKQAVKMLLCLSLLVLLLEVVSAFIIPNRRNGLESEEGGLSVQGTEAHKVKREVGESREWEKICKTESETRFLVPAIDNDGNQILQLSATGSVDYQEFVRVERCQDSVAHVGGVTVQCVQEYLEHTLVVFDTNTGQEKTHRPSFYPSGCSAKVLKPR